MPASPADGVPARPGSPAPSADTPTDPAPSARATALSGTALNRAVRAFNLYDGGMSAFSSIILTFVFSTYIASAVAPAGAVGEAAKAVARDHGSAVLGTAQTWGAVAIALLAPLLGNLADSGGHRNRLLRITTITSIAAVAAMVVVKLDAAYLWVGAILIAVALVASELAGVFANSVLPQISTPENRGRVSGTAWALGYWGSIISLSLVLVLFVMPGTGLLGLPADDGWNYRGIPVFVALWMLAGTIPLMRRAPELPRRVDAKRWTPWQGYRDIGVRVVSAWREERTLLYFLVSSAIYRDGLGAIFSLAGVLAANAYGFTGTQVIIFGIAANLIAGLGVYVGGFVDDRIGPRWVIIGGCVGIILLGLVVFAFSAPIVFWVCGLAICLFVGPVQSASRNLLTRLSKADRETEDFGLYAMTGRALGFLGPAAFTFAVVALGGTRMGMAGILAVLVVGLAAFLPIRLGDAGRAARTLES